MLVDELLLAARTAAGLVLSMHQAVNDFDTFLVRADRVRPAVEDVTGSAIELTAQVAQLLGLVACLVQVAVATVRLAASTWERAVRAVTDVDALTARAARGVATQGVAGGSEELADARDVVTGWSASWRSPASSPGPVGQIGGTAHDLAKQAGPVVELAVQLADRVAEPAETIAAAAAAPAVAALTPDLLDAVAELAAHLLDLLNTLDTQVLPTRRQLQRTPRDVKAHKDSVEGSEPKLCDMEAELTRLPGAKLRRRRGRRTDQPAPEPAPLAPPPLRRRPSRCRRTRHDRPDTSRSGPDAPPVRASAP